MSEVKPEEISHPAMEQLQGFEYCIDSNPPWGEYPRACNRPAFAFSGLDSTLKRLLLLFRGGDYTGLPALHPGSGHGGDDPDRSGAHDGRKRCECFLIHLT